MDKTVLLTRLELFSQCVENQTAEINISLINQSNQRKERYRGAVLNTSLNDVGGAVKKTLAYIKEEVERRSLDVYDLVISLDDSVQTVPEANVIHGAEIISQLSVDCNGKDVVDEKTDLSKIRFMVMQVFDGASGDSLYLFSKYVQPATAYRTAEKYFLSGGVLRPFTKKVITIRVAVDAFLIDGTYYVLHRNNFNSIFSYKDIYSRVIENNIGTINQCGLMRDPARFIADCESDGRYVGRLAKAILAKGFEEVAARKGSVKQIVDDFGLSLKITDTGEIDYTGKEDIPVILNLILRHYVIDALTNNKMIAAAIQEYQTLSDGGGR